MNVRANPKELILTEGIKQGEKDLKSFLEALNLLFKKIYQKSSDL